MAKLVDAPGPPLRTLATPRRGAPAPTDFDGALRQVISPDSIRPIPPFFSLHPDEPLKSSRERVRYFLHHEREFVQARDEAPWTRGFRVFPPRSGFGRGTGFHEEGGGA
jgi:hypothetical protein